MVSVFSLISRLASCERCKATYAHDPADLHRLGFHDDPTAPAPELWMAVGCSSCSNTGYRGRMALHEIMSVSEEIERLTVAHASAAEIAKVAISQGMTTLRQDGWAKARAGLTSIEEILRVVA